jgi:hypothetical protein
MVEICNISAGGYVLNRHGSDAKNTVKSSIYGVLT